MQIPTAFAEKSRGKPTPEALAQVLQDSLHRTLLTLHDEPFLTNSNIFITASQK